MQLYYAAEHEQKPMPNDATYLQEPIRLSDVLIIEITLLEGGQFLSSSSTVTWLDKACQRYISELLEDSVRRR